MSDDPTYEDRVAAAEASIEGALDPGAQSRRDEDDRVRRRASEQRQAFLIQMMQHPVGRVVLKEMLDRFHAFETRFASVNGMARDVEWDVAPGRRTAVRLEVMVPVG